MLHSGCFGPNYFVPSLYNQGPIYSLLFAVILVVVYFAVTQKRERQVEDLPILNRDNKIQQFDIMGLPLESSIEIHDSEDSILFTPIDQKILWQYKLFAFFAALVGILYLLK